VESTYAIITFSHLDAVSGLVVLHTVEPLFSWNALFLVNLTVKYVTFHDAYAKELEFRTRLPRTFSFHHCFQHSITAIVLLIKNSDYTNYHANMNRERREATENEYTLSTTNTHNLRRSRKVCFQHTWNNLNNTTPFLSC